MSAVLEARPRPVSASVSPPAAPPPEAVRAALRTHFGFDGLRPGQADALRPVLEGRDALVVMPTGAGKSLVYQLAALLRTDGVTVVVSPLIALMKDQVDALRARGVEAAYVNSSQTVAEQREALGRLKAGELRLVYAAPERLRVPSFQRALREAHVTLLAVDEAHCVSQWGHDFRPDYLTIADAREAMGGPPCVALTATATPRVQDDIAAQLRLHAPDRLVTGFNRPNLRFEVRSTATAKQKRRVLLQFLAEHDGEAGLVYVGTRKEAEALAAFIRTEAGRPCEAYHAGLPDAERAHVQEQFVGGRLGTVVATNAFGMGVDRGDVRFVAHWSIPSNLEAYYQEAGRAGRDGRPAVALLLYAPQDRQLKEWFIEQGAPTVDDLRNVYNHVKRQHARRRPKDDERAASGGESDGEFLLAMSDALGIHASKLPNVLSRLKRAGALVERDDRAGAARWTPQAWNQRAVREALQSIEKHSGDLTASLLGIVRYAQSSDCRRRAILDHFGDATEADVPPEDCCDACRTNARLKTEAPDEVPDWDALPMNARVALGLLDAVRRMRWPVGRLTLAKILAGSKAQGMEKYERHPYYGRLATIGQGAVDGIYKDLLLKGYLRIGGDEYPIVELTPLGEQALDHREAIDVDVPAFGSPRRSASGSSPAPDGDLDPADEALFERLRAWRTERATERSVPPYVVFNDKTLRALAVARPSTEAEILAVSGVGPAKWEAYGAEVLDLIAEAA